MDLIEAHPASFIATDDVAAEIADAYPDQQTRYEVALNSGQVSQQRVDDPAELMGQTTVSKLERMTWAPHRRHVNHGTRQAGRAVVNRSGEI
jgi:hypothetical protein